MMGFFSKKYFMAFGCSVALTLSFFFSPPTNAHKILNRDDVEHLFQEKLKNMQALIAAKDIKSLQQQAYEMTHPKTIVLFEFSLKNRNVEMPTQKAYFNRDPFLALFENAGLLDGEQFEMSYTLDKFYPQYGGGSAIIYDSGTASGRVREPFGRSMIRFDMTQTCRNTISTHAEHMFVIDSIYCRMQIDYNPLDHQNREIIPETALENPQIDDIMSEIDAERTHSD